MSVKPGAVVCMKNSFKDWTPTMEVSYRTEKGYATVFMLLGSVKQDQYHTFDGEAAIRNLGWVPETEKDEALAALKKTVAVLDELLPQLGKVTVDVGALNQALIAARPLLA